MTTSAKLAHKILSVYGNGPGTEFLNILNDAGADGSGSFTTVDATTVTATTYSTDEGDVDIEIGSTGSVGSVVIDSASTVFGSAFFVTDSLASFQLTGTSGAATMYLGATSGGASGSTTRIYTKSDFPDNTATAIITVSVPNAKHGGMLFLRIAATNGSGECVNVGTGTVAICRSAAGVATVVTASTLAATATAQDATGLADTNTLAYAVSAVSGAASATQTFSITLTLNDSGGSATNKAVVVAQLINFETSGITMTAAA